MANRRSLIGEVSLPKISEKVRNRINVELFDNPSVALTTYNAQVDIDYVVSENTILSVYLSDGAWITIRDSLGTTHLFNDVNIGSSQGVTVTSWTPLEDDNYKYIVFPMHLVVGDNGDKGKVLYEYLIAKYSNLGNSININDDIWIDGVEIFAKDKHDGWGISFDYDESIYFTSYASISYFLYANGKIEKIDTGNQYD